MGQKASAELGARLRALRTRGGGGSVVRALARDGVYGLQSFVNLLAVPRWKLRLGRAITENELRLYSQAALQQLQPTH